MARRPIRKRPSSRKNEGVIHLPESEQLLAAKLSKAQLQKMVTSILGGQSGRGIDSVKLVGGPKLSGKVGGGLQWTKTIWRRAC